MTTKKYIDPLEFDLPPRTILEQIDANTIAILIKRKSRIIMADGKKILAKADKIRHLQPGVTIIVHTSAPVCSKTIGFLESRGIEVTSFA